MNGSVVAAAAAAAAATLAVGAGARPSPPARRLRRVLPPLAAPAGRSDAAAERAGHAEAAGVRAGRGDAAGAGVVGTGAAGTAGAGVGAGTASRRWAAATAAVAVALLLGGPAGIAAGFILAFALDKWLGRLEPRSEREHRRRIQGDLPLCLDLIAACLQGGAPLPQALAAVADATGGPLGAELHRVLAALQVGASPAQAWQRDRLPSELLPVARALASAGESGAAVADAVSRLATEQRELAAAAADEAARRAGVLAVLPLGVCFLPAFVLVGVVPFVLGVAERVLP